MMQRYKTAEEFLSLRRPVDPVRCRRPFAVLRAADWFHNRFSGELIYAVKANTSPFVIEALNASGVQRFDVASLTEVETIYHSVPGAELFYMNPVKSRAHIRSAYFDYGVRTFSVDHVDEVHKILEVTENANDLSLFVRLHCNDRGSVLPLGKKYGAEGRAAVELLQLVRSVAARLGVTFHVGSQALEPARFGEAIHHAADLVRRAGVVAELMNVGGGFPACYRASDPVDLGIYIDVIETAISAMPMVHDAQLFAEPGRALSAEAESLIVRVDARRGHELFINDGGYGVLYDAANCDWIFPARLIGDGGACYAEGLEAFSFWGPTCDAADRMKGPFLLPGHVAEGDYLEIHKTGAYGSVMASGFNGFGCYEEIELEDEVMLSNFLPNYEAASVG
ncbi:MAG: ornithine decarboxylase [Rhodomicrobium sp.]|nr:MAG: ornithine decarboxylase [Rhodomicrobium sp.]